MLYAWVHNHVDLVLELAFLASTIIGYLPAPGPTSGKAYKGIYGFLHFCAANSARVLAMTRFAYLLPGYGRTIPNQIEQVHVKEAIEDAKAKQP